MISVPLKNVQHFTLRRREKPASLESSFVHLLLDLAALLVPFNLPCECILVCSAMIGLSIYPEQTGRERCENHPEIGPLHLKIEVAGFPTLTGSADLRLPLNASITAGL